MQTSVGRRERKKAATRQAISDAALALFVERGFDNVGVREIAETADVSTTTLFKHFPTKEALVFDDDVDHEIDLVECVRGREPGQSIPDALRDYLVSSRIAPRSADANLRTFTSMVESSATLRDYADRMWLRHETALAAAIAEEVGAVQGDPRCIALAHFALQTPRLARTSSDPVSTANAAFDLLERGWRK